MKVGVLGGGQLGQMLALAGLPLGLRFRFLEPADESPAGQVAERIIGSFEDRGLSGPLRRRAGRRHLRVRERADGSGPPAGAARSRSIRRRPRLEVSQDRLAEKKLFDRLDIPTTQYVAVDTRADLEQAVGRLGYPAVLKTRRFGYDGKGQMVLRGADDVERAWRAVGRPVPDCWRSTLPSSGNCRNWRCAAGTAPSPFTRSSKTITNTASSDWSLAPAPGATADLQHTANDYALRVLNALEYVGVLAIEFFQRDGRLIANEMAPRVHNSGHWTIEGAGTSQFENHFAPWSAGRSARRPRPVAVAMLNLIGAAPPSGNTLGPAGRPCPPVRQGAAAGPEAGPRHFCDADRDWCCGGWRRRGKRRKALTL